jgi:multidrug transporter EmrE-like cation transporter
MLVIIRMDPKLLFFVLLLTVLCVAEYIGDSNFKIYSRSGEQNSLVIGLIAYGILIYLLIEALSHANLIYTNGMWNGIYTIMTTLLAYFLLNERLNNAYQWIGILLVISGTLLLGIGNIPR